MSYEQSKIALSIDLEDWYHIPAVSGSWFSPYKNVESFFKEWKGRYDYITTPTRKILEVLESKKITCTFFIVANIIDYYPHLVEEICSKGHEIACHGFDHSMKYNPGKQKLMFSIEEFEERTIKAKEKLEEFTGKKLIGYRAPGAYFSKQLFDSLSKIGFKYDSSLSPNSFYNKTDIDIKKISSAPYLLKTNFEDLIEIPWPFFKWMGLKFPTGGGPILRFMPLWYIKKGINQSLKRGNTVFYLHSLDVCEESLPGLASKNSRRPFYFKTSGKKTFNKLLKFVEIYHTRITTCKEIFKMEQC